MPLAFDTIPVFVSVCCIVVVVVVASGDAAALLKHHTAPITSVEWHPTDSSVFASAGADDQVCVLPALPDGDLCCWSPLQVVQWDLAVERDEEEEDENGSVVEGIPPQLLFIHQVRKTNSSS